MARSRTTPGPAPRDPDRRDVPPIDAETQLYAVIGHPVAHSLSPRMQNAAFRAAGKNAAYVALDVPRPRLAEALAGLHAAGFRGLNVTLPHKEEALRLSHSATPAARAAGAANTLRRGRDGWEAEATDGGGFLAWMEELGLRAEGARVLLLGAGGAARAIAAALAAGGAASIRIVNRHEERATAVAEAAAAVAAGATRVDTGSWERADPEAKFDFLVRALSVEAVSAEERRWWDAVAPGSCVLDLNYGARARAAREEAGRAGLRFEDGLALLVEQGALSYEFWTGERAPRAAMQEALS
ncbi:MAG: shikimate dehydrogenase family protein [Bacteroidota bacterium]